MAAVHLSRQDALMDEKLCIKVSGLKPKQVVTVYAKTVEQGKRFASFAVYIANEQGEINLSTDPSLIGTYTGVEPMGLFWSMTPEPGQKSIIRLIQKYAIEPRITLLQIYPGQLTWEDLCNNQKSPVTEQIIRRWYKAKNVIRKVVKHVRFRGTIFLPEGDGPFPGVVDMYGGMVDLVESRGALLASHGFAAYSLAFQSFLDDTLPDSAQLIDFQYVEDATRWFLSQPFVQPGGIGITAVCFGGALALRLAAHLPEVRVVVNINGHPFHMFPFLKYGDGEIQGSVLKVEAAVRSDEGIVTKHFFHWDENSVTPCWRHGAKILTLVSGDDQSVNPSYHYWARQLAPKDKQANMEIVYYPGAGHLIEPPYAPLSRTVPNHDTQVNWPADTDGFLFGGDTKQHAKAQEDGWSRLLQFLVQHLVHKPQSVVSRL